MYYIFKFYMENDGKDIAVTKIFETVRSALKIRYDQYYFTYFEHDQTDEGVYRAFEADSKGKSQFIEMLSRLRCQMDPTRDDLYLGAESGNRNGLRKVVCELSYTHSSLTVLTIGFPKSAKLNVSQAIYVDLLHRLAQLGFIIDNSFCHYTYTLNARLTFDAGQIGYAFYIGKRRIKQAAKHRRCGYKKRIPDVYWGNSLSETTLSEDDEYNVYRVLPDGLVQKVAGNFVFTMSRFCKPYSIAAYRRYRKIRSILKRYIA